MADGFRTKMKSLQSSKIWIWKHFILLGLALMILMFGITIGSLPLIFMGLILAGFGLALWHGASKFLAKGVEKLHSTVIAKYGLPDRFSSVTTVKEDDFLNVMLYGAKDEKGDRFFHGISGVFNNEFPKDAIAESERQLNALYVAYDKGEIALANFFEAQINDYLKRRVESENKFRKARGQREKEHLVDINYKKSSLAFTQDVKEGRISEMAANMSHVFSKYLNKSPDNRFANEDFGFDENGRPDNKNKNLNDYFDDFLKNEMSKTRISKLAYGFLGGIVGGLAALGLFIASLAKYDIYQKLDAMYSSIGLGGQSGVMSVILGVIITAIIFTVAAYIYNKHEEKVPERLKAESVREQNEINNPMIPTNNNQEENVPERLNVAPNVSVGIHPTHNPTVSQ